MTSKLNKSGIKPLGVAVLVEPYDDEYKTSAIVLPDTVKARTIMVEAKAVVIDVGPAAWKDEAQPRAKPGDKVMITKYAGTMIYGPKDKVLYRMVNDRDIFAGIEEEA